MQTTKSTKITLLTIPDTSHLTTPALTAPPHFLVPSQPELFLWRRFESGLPQETVCTTVYREADSGIFLGDTQCKGIPIEVIFCQNINVELLMFRFYPKGTSRGKSLD